MIESKIPSLLKSLIKKTYEKNAIWDSTSREGEFQLELATGTITIVEYSDNYNNKSYNLSIFNKDSRQIFNEFYENEKGNEEINDLIKTLYGHVTNIFYKVEETVEGLLGELMQEGKVGGKKEQDDDLPF